MATAQAYRTPPQALVDLVDAPVTPEVRLSPDQQWLLVMERPSWPPISELARPELRLAGIIEHVQVLEERRVFLASFSQERVGELLDGELISSQCFFRMSFNVHSLLLCACRPFCREARSLVKCAEQRRQRRAPGVITRHR